MPPSAFTAVATLAPKAVTAVPPRVSDAPEAAIDPVKHCDLSTTCPQCDSQMRPEHAHYRCEKCGYRDACGF
jgi:Zn finger protein HypA/HybF involved in hydrogenase expression